MVIVIILLLVGIVEGLNNFHKSDKIIMNTSVDPTNIHINSNPCSTNNEAICVFTEIP